MPENEKELTPLSASRIKTLETCAMVYKAKYILKIPEPSSTVATAMGSTMHEALELLFKADKSMFNKARKHGVKKEKELVKLINEESSKYGLEKESVETIYQMIENVISDDNFFGDKDGNLVENHAELPFDIVQETPNGKFRIKGFIDRIHLDGTGHLHVRDYKSSKKLFEGKDISSNIQGSMYCYAGRKLFPDSKSSHCEFWFTRFDLKNGGKIILPKVSDYENLGLEIELATYQNIVENIDDDFVENNLAAAKGYPSDNSFSGMVACGYAKYPGHLKKDGTPYWHCSFKFPFEFYAIVDEDGNRIKTAVLNEKHLLEQELKEGQKIKKFKYRGCPYWNR